MAYSITQGVLGLDGVHQIDPYSSPAGPVMRGVHSYASDSWIKLDRITGLYSLGDMEPLTQNRSGAHGEVVYPSLTRGRTITYEGRIVGKTLNKLREQIGVMRPWLMGLPGAVPVFPHERGPGKRLIPIRISPPDNLGIGFTYDCAITAFELDDEQPYGPTRRPSPWMRSFILTVRQHDPRYYWDHLEIQEFGGEETTEDDGGDYMTVVNDGNADSQHFNLLIPGPVDDVAIDNLTTEKRLEFLNVDVAADHYFFVGFATRQAFGATNVIPSTNPSTNKAGKLRASTSDWWDPFEQGLVPGENDIRVGGNSVAEPVWIAHWQHANW